MRQRLATGGRSWGQRLGGKLALDIFSVAVQQSGMSLSTSMSFIPRKQLLQSLCRKIFLRVVLESQQLKNYNKNNKILVGDYLLFYQPISKDGP